jgi:hypothetical protein
MQSILRQCTDTVKTGLLAGAGTTVAVMACGKAEAQGGIAPLNAVSHIPFGDKAARQDQASLKYTLTGLLLNMAAVSGWAAMQQWLVRRNKRSLLTHLAAGATTAATAYVVDYHVVPKRFTPGFEERLSPRSLAVVYGVLAVSLAAGSLLGSRDD